MLDKKSIANLLILAVYTGCFNFYLYELFYGTWNIVSTKNFYYLSTVIALIWLDIDRATGLRTFLNEQTNFICSRTIILNFIIIILSLNNIVGAMPWLYFEIINGSIFMLTIMILTSGGRHEYFKD